MNVIGTYIASMAGIPLPPPVALLFTITFVVFLFRRDFREQRSVTSALWLPLLWLLILGSRAPTNWLNTFGMSVGGPSAEDEGTPIDAVVYFTLIVSGFYVLNKRQVSLSEVVQNNGWLVAFLAYCFLAIIWSDLPFVAFKRWIKILGHPIMALIVLTEPDPQESLARLMKRSAYILIPFSILVIKYYEGIGRRFDELTGAATNRGICNTKNGLGTVCMILGFFFFWQLLKTWRSERSRIRRNELRLIGGFLIMICWLTSKAHSMTPLLSMLIAILVMVALNLRFVNKRVIGTYVILAAVTLVVAELSFGIVDVVVDLTGHASTFSGREDLWGELLAFHTNPIFGVGFESFWMGDRIRALWEAHWWHPTEAHNGYLETYLNLGLIGLFMLAGVIIATFRKIRLELLRNFEWGRFRLGFLFAAVAFNWTEAAFKGLNPVWFVFYIIALDYRNFRFTSMEPSLEAVESKEEEMELAYLPDGYRNLQISHRHSCVALRCCAPTGNARFPMRGIKLACGAILIVGILLTVLGQAEGAIINAKSVSLADVNSAIGSASDGDTVVVPPGTASWTSRLNITKGITLRGANTNPGDDLTIILDDVTRRLPDHGRVIGITLTPAQSFRMTGITFRNGSTFTQKGQQSNSGTVSATSTGNSPCKSFRIDHCHFDGLYSSNYLQIGGWIYGVIDHCIFDGRNPGAGQSILVMHTSWGGGANLFGDGSWADPPYFGSEKFIFIEDCILNNPAANQTNMSVDCYGGGRYVSRHNTINNCGLGGGSHGTETGGRLRSGRCNETYNNTLTSTQGKASGGQLRGGTSLVHDNTINGLRTAFKNLTCYREFWPFHSWGGANGKNPWDLNDSHGIYESGKHSGLDNSSTLAVAGTPWTANQWKGYTVSNTTQNVRSKAGDTFQYASFILSNTANTITFHIDNTYGVPMFFNAGDGYEIHRVLTALDQPGRGKGDLLRNGSGGKPINTAAGNTIAWPHQALEPVYYWNNGGSSGIAARSSYPTIQANRDYYNLGNDFAANSTPPAVSSKYVAALNGQDYSGPYPYPHPLVSRAAPSPAAVRPVGN